MTANPHLPNPNDCTQSLAVLWPQASNLGRWPAAEGQLSRLQVDLRRQVGTGTWQLFCFDPNGARVELDFDAAESL